MRTEHHHYIADPLGIIGKYIDQYRIERYIDRGSSAYLYQAQFGGVPMVLKLLRPEHDDNPHMRQRFEREAYLLKHLHHPHIVRLLGNGRYQHRPYLVFEHAQYGSLEQYIEQIETPLTLGDVVRIVQQTASALHYLHENGFVHRDVKPSNILLRQLDDIALADFGIVGGGDIRTHHRTQPGTINFMAPEQLNSLSADHTTDQFALATMTYWLLTGARPFSAQDRDEADIQRQLTLPSVHELHPRLPAELDDVLQRALQSDMRNRYIFIEEFAYRIAQIIRQHQLDQVTALGKFVTITYRISHHADHLSVPTVPNRDYLSMRAGSLTWVILLLAGIIGLMLAIYAYLVG